MNLVSGPYVFLLYSDNIPDAHTVGEARWLSRYSDWLQAELPRGLSSSPGGGEEF
jgi:hypothetical protein